MRCLISLALGLLALEAALALAPKFIAPVQVMCPESSSSEETSCLSDDDCLGSAVCCPSTAGSSCRTPIIVPTPKAGRCPWVQAPMLSQLCEELSDCANDIECRGDKKCCFSRCAMRYLEPILGMRPEPSPVSEQSKKRSVRSSP
ncbi:whey acidic protein [Lepus europaeus]|uniref:whey acidic protein n=1 Tax=Lepus europaeus TaxID=9983 RepID=UPI002B4695E8|nr:whey acidic protein [Lepus europaeus]